ncbi:hypothetical protein [Meiothermus sp.]|uniref:hypothetical protein n=1 Tax=Meiothermus sp. TaxID=1955249 RepID=UPI0021DF07A5|nr:hypothetical protein [Meiothermus sp.]GIW33756.1 MAG: hypothetical protein KatS3mg072_1089 [Meiothermus sp.]
MQISPYDIETLVQATTEAILNQPADERASWVLLLLENLDVGVALREGKEQANALLHPIIRCAYDRWNTGRWG